MPQDNLRSTIYRSFVTCDVPKGVVDCKTIKSTNSKKMEDNFKNHKIEHNSSASEDRKDKFLKRSSYQIMEVSKEAEKLNEVISSFSNRGSFDHKHIALDLLRGVIDLQESLEMLGKLQEASKFINKRHNNNNKEKKKPEIRFMDFEKPRNISRSSSRDCFDELRDLITESFSRQNMLPKVISSKRDEDFLDAKNLDFGIDFASSSTSSSCSWSNVVNEKSKGPNLIAKLMGLEEEPKEMDSIMYKRVEKEKLSNGRIRLLDLGLPRARKPQFVVQKVAHERRMLEEMMEIQFKGLLERDGKDCNRDVPVEGPPIVIMRPRHICDLRSEDVHRSYGIKEERNMKSRRKPIKAKMKENLRVEKVSKQKLNKDKEVVKCCGEERRKTNHSKPMVPRVRKKEIFVKKIETMAKEASNTRKHAEIKDEDTRDDGKITTLKLKKSGRGSNVVSKCQIAPKKNASPKKKMKPTSNLKPNAPKKNLQKGKHERKLSEALVENIEIDDHFQSNIKSDVEGSLIKSIASEQTTEKVMDASYISTPDNSGNEESSPCESSIKEDDIKYIEDGSCISSHSLDTKEACKSSTNTRYLLLSNFSFLNRAHELFECDLTISEAVFPTDTEILDASLLLDCAKEILERKSLLCSRMMITPLSQNHLFINPKSSVSLEKLVLEICDEFDHLRSYSKSCDGVVLEDSIYPMLERDLLWNGEVTSAWDLGWRNNNGYTVEEVDELVHDVEKLVLTEIVDDVVIEFML